MSWQLLSETTPRARKQHRCEWCPEPIEVGEKHARYVGIFDGDLQVTRMHTECLDASVRSDPATDAELCQERHDRGLDCEQMGGH